MIPEKIIDDIREKSDIVEVVGAVLDLKRAGGNFKALCPFHGEKTPSFMVSPAKQIFHCFGCGKGGNVFNFIMEYEGVSFVEAVRKLGAGAGVDVEQYLSAGGDRGKYDLYYRAMEFAANYYKDILLEDQCAEGARSYLERRGFDSDMIGLFGLGYAPSVWDNLYKAATDAGIERNALLELRLVDRNRGGSGYRDYFRNRVIFPIHTLSNRVVALAGRVLDDSQPKYLNSAESPIYSKGKILYGLNQAKDDIRKSSSAIIVEGYIDYLMLWKKGFGNIAAVCGTSLTADQARLLARYAKRVYIINDGDRAGIRAAVRAADRLLVEGLDIKVVILPEEEDPDSFVRKNGAEALREKMHSAPDYFSYLKLQAEKGPRVSHRKNQVVKHLLDSISNLEDGVGRELLLQELSALFDLPLDTLRGGLKEGRGRRKEPEPGRPATSGKRERIQKELFRIGLENSSYARKIIGTLTEEDLEGEPFRNFYKVLDYALKNNIDTTSPEFAAGLKDPELSILAADIALLDLPPGPVDELLRDSLLWIKKAALRVEMASLKKRMNELLAGGGEEKSREGLEIAEAYRKIARELGKMGLKEDGRSDGSG